MHDNSIIRRFDVQMKILLLCFVFFSDFWLILSQRSDSWNSDISQNSIFFLRTLNFTFNFLLRQIDATFATSSSYKTCLSDVYRYPYRRCAFLKCAIWGTIFFQTFFQPGLFLEKIIQFKTFLGASNTFGRFFVTPLSPNIFFY